MQKIKQARDFSTISTVAAASAHHESPAASARDVDEPYKSPAELPKPTVTPAGKNVSNIGKLDAK